MCAGEAAHREVTLASKVERLNKSLDEAQLAADKQYNARVEEERMISRIDMLQTILSLYKKVCAEPFHLPSAVASMRLRTLLQKTPEDEIRKEMERMCTEKERYNNESKEKLQHAFEEKVCVRFPLSHEKNLLFLQGDALRKLSVAETSLRNAERDVERLTKELSEARERYSTMTTEFDVRFLLAFVGGERVEKSLLCVFSRW